MLVLSRQRDESIIIADNIKITIVDIRGDKVRLGIDAPKEIPVHPQEVFDAIQRENDHENAELAHTTTSLTGCYQPDCVTRQADRTCLNSVLLVSAGRHLACSRQTCRPTRAPTGRRHSAGGPLSECSEHCSAATPDWTQPRCLQRGLLPLHGGG